MHSEEKTALGATQESPTSPHSEGSAPGAHLEPPRDPGAHHHLSSGHSGTHLPGSGLQSFFLSPLESSFPSSPTPLAPYHRALCLSSLVTSFVLLILQSFMYLVHFYQAPLMQRHCWGPERCTTPSILIKSLLSSCQRVSPKCKKGQPHKIYLSDISP